jgi:hypothetical protein
MDDDSRLGFAISQRTAERRLLTWKEYWDIESVSEARWEFIGFEDDELTPERFSAVLQEFGFTPGGPTVIRGELVEVEPGMFRLVDGDAADAPKNWFER